MKVKIIILLISCIFSGVGLKGASVNYDREILFENISNEEGLSHSTVYTILQDSLGYMWFGTQDGLNRYDGNTFQVFLPYEEDEQSVISNQIRALLLDRKGNLWVGGNKGVSRYRCKSNDFVNYSLFSTHYDRYIADIKEDVNGVIWAISRNGDLYRYNGEEDDFQVVPLPMPLNNLITICPLKNRRLIGTEQGLFDWNASSGTLSEVKFQGKSANVRVILPEKTGGFWVGTEGDGLYHLDEELKVQEHFSHNVYQRNTLCNDNVRSLAFDSQGKLWIGTFVGLSVYDSDSKVFSNYQEEFGRKYALSQNSVRSICADNNGGMWLGTYYGGINYYHSSNIKFDLINQNGGQFSLNDNVVSSIKEDSKGNFWIATNDKGLNYWEPKSNRIRYFEHDEKDSNSLSSNNIKDVLVLDSEHILVGTHQSGLNYFAPRTKKNKIFTHSSDPYSIANNSVYALLKDHTEKIWVGTFSGLDRFDPQTGRFWHFQHDSRGEQLTSREISYLFEDSRHRIWIGTFEGLNIYYPQKNLLETFKNQPENPNSLTNNEIGCIIEDSKGRIWIGTKQGLNLFDEINREFVSYGVKDGFSNNAICGIIEDYNGCFWVSSFGGLSCFNHKERKVKNYDSHDGILSMQFNRNSFCKSNKGKFLFGGTNGVTMFYPDQVVSTPFNPKVFLTELKISNQRIQVGDASNILKKPLRETKGITLKHNQNVLSLKYTSINFNDSQKIKYKYILKGFDKYWKYGNENREVQYANLPVGNYCFQIKSVSGEGVENDLITTLNVVVLPPWWCSSIAYVCYLILIIGIIWISIRLIRERIRTHNQLKIERLEKQKITEINKMKLQFFTNISHEFRTPLTLILSPLEKIRERGLSDEWLKQQHDVIYKSTRRLLTLIDQLMDFRKSEMGSLGLQVSQGEMVSFINEIYLSFASVASQNNIVYTFDAQDEKMELFFDASYVEKIAFNLLSNAFKFTPCKGTIGIQLFRSGKWAVIKVSDSGKGIPQDKLSLIFERFYRIDENTDRPGSGIGLALTKRLVELHHGTIEVDSESGKGSVFTVRIPMDENIYQEDQIVDHRSVKNNAPDASLYEMDSHDMSQPQDQKEKKASILIVEDSTDIANYLRDNLKDSYQIFLAANGKEGLTQVGEMEPDLIITDIMMPVMDGIKFCKTMKQNIRTCHIPILLLTAKTALDDQIEGLDIGADDYMAKPFSMNLLEAKVRNILKSRKRLREYYSQNTDVQPQKLAFNTLDEELLTKAVNIIEEHLSEPELSVDFFAKKMGMSRSNLHLKLKAITGESATDFIKKIQFRKAKNLLAENRYSVAEISYMVGFNSPSYFTTSFKKYFGYLPSEYIEKQKVKNS